MHIFLTTNVCLAPARLQALRNHVRKVKHDVGKVTTQCLQSELAKKVKYALQKGKTTMLDDFEVEREN